MANECDRVQQGSGSGIWMVKRKQDSKNGRQMVEHRQDSGNECCEARKSK